MALQHSTTLRNARADALTTAVGNAGLLAVFSGSAPANCAAADTGTKLVEWTCGSPFAPAATNGTLLPTLPSNVNAIATGTGGHYRLKTSGGTVVDQGTVGTSGADLNLLTTAITSGQPCQVTTWSRVQPGA